MSEVTNVDVRMLAQAYKALGDETRLRILAVLLATEELCVCRFEELLGIGQSKASRHLRYLLNSGLVEGRREGIWVHYRIADDLPAELEAVVESVRKALGPEELNRIAQAVAGAPGEEQSACAVLCVPSRPASRPAAPQPS
ncbi:MAG: hypothetical protein Kow00129_13300 [Thermoleophilia bacterium]